MNPNDTARPKIPLESPPSLLTCLQMKCTGWQSTRNTNSPNYTRHLNPRVSLAYSFSLLTFYINIWYLLWMPETRLRTMVNQVCTFVERRRRQLSTDHISFGVSLRERHVVFQRYDTSNLYQSPPTYRSPMQGLSHVNNV